MNGQRTRGDKQVWEINSEGGTSKRQTNSVIGSKAHQPREQAGSKVTGNEECSEAAGSGDRGGPQCQNLTWTGSEGHHLRSRKGRLFFCVGCSEENKCRLHKPC